MTALDDRLRQLDADVREDQEQLARGLVATAKAIHASGDERTRIEFERFTKAIGNLLEHVGEMGQVILELQQQ